MPKQVIIPDNLSDQFVLYGPTSEIRIDESELVSMDANNQLSIGADGRLRVGPTLNDIDIRSGNVDGQNVTLKVDNDDFGWADIIAPITVRGGGANNPAWVQFRDGIFGYEFQSSRSNEFWASYHLNHDYALGTPIFPHVHWSPVTAQTGTVRWTLEYTVAKGHQQTTGSVFGHTQTISMLTTISQPSQYMHFVTEVPEAQGLTSSLFEPDALIVARWFRHGANDTYPASVIGFTTDIHYQVARASTKNRAPNFYGDNS